MIRAQSRERSERLAPPLPLGTLWPPLFSDSSELSRSSNDFRFRFEHRGGKVGAACMASVPAVAFLNDLDVITAIIGLATFGLGWTMVNYLAFTGEVSVKKVSTAAGILGGAGALSGAGFMLVVGNLVEETGNFAIAFGLVGAMPLVALAGIWYASSSTPPLRMNL